MIREIVIKIVQIGTSGKTNILENIETLETSPKVKYEVGRVKINTAMVENIISENIFFILNFSKDLIK